MAALLSIQSKTVLERFQIRKTKQQTEQFRAWLCETLEREGYAPRTEASRTLISNHNVVVGDPAAAKLLLGAHYDTCAAMPTPNFITPRNFAIYLLYQLLLTAVIFAAAAVPAVIAVVLGAPKQVTLLIWYAALLLCLWLMMCGKANRHTVNDNSSGVMTLLEIALALPEEERESVCFVFFDNEEKGVLGSAAFFKTHKKELADTLMLNFDCVSDGDYIQFYPTSKVKQDETALRRLRETFPSTPEKTVEVVRGFGFYPSDQKAFPRGVGVCALKKKPVIGYYMDRIHTKRDTVLEEENLMLLRDGVLRLVHIIEK